MTIIPSSGHPSRVGLFHDPELLRYPDHPPFDPSVHYPEDPSHGRINESVNRIYDAVRQTLMLLGLDEENAGKPDWNPLGGLVQKGGRVIIKPNLVDLKQGWIALGGERILDMVTHGSVLRPLVDYAFKAVGEEGRIIICDAPLVHADFEGVVKAAGIEAMVRFLRDRGYPLTLMDLREEYFARWTAEYQKLPGDPLGNSVLDLGTQSALDPLDTSPPAQYFTLADHTDERIEPVKHHYKGRHEYCIPNSVLDSDLFINVPKLKTHVKTGVTLSLKNLMGMTHYRRWMPHHRTGAPPAGDEFPIDPGVILRNRERLIGRIAKLPGGTALIRTGAYLRHGVARIAGRRDRTIIHGGWYGNDTLWRTLVDLNRVLFYGRPGGELTTRRRAYLSLVDGIIGGEGNGPVKPTPRPAGVVAASYDPVALDTVLSHIMGYDPERIRIIQGAGAAREPFWIGHCKSEMISVESNLSRQQALGMNLNFREPLGWEGYLKRSVELRPEMKKRLEQMGTIHWESAED